MDIIKVLCISVLSIYGFDANAQTTKAPVGPYIGQLLQLLGHP